LFSLSMNLERESLAIIQIGLAGLLLLNRKLTEYAFLFLLIAGFVHLQGFTTAQVGLSNSFV
jgi:hypothetical protein